MSRERVLFVIGDGVLIPHSELDRARLREKGYRRGDVLSAELTKPRNPRFHRLAHALGRLIADNVEAFEGMDAHRVLKRLQWESGHGCEEMGVQVPGAGLATVRWPRSLSFASMDEGEFREIYSGLCRHVAKTYWSGLDEAEVERMAELMTEAS